MVRGGSSSDVSLSERSSNKKLSRSILAGLRVFLSVAVYAFISSYSSELTSSSLCARYCNSFKYYRLIQ